MNTPGHNRPPHTSERQPSGEARLLVDQVTPDLEKFTREVNDDPTCTLETLAPQEQAKIKLRVVAAHHTPEHTAEIATAIGSVDYYITEGLMKEDFPRSLFDAAMNLRAVGLRVAVRMGTKEPVELDRLEDGFYEAIKADARSRHNPPPVFRSMDMQYSDPSPLDGFQTFGEAWEYCKNILMPRLQQGLYNDDNNALLAIKQELADKLPLLAVHRNTVQANDLSVIIANAVRRHPELSTITVGVMVGAGHDSVRDTLVERTGIQSTLEHVPPRNPAEYRPYNLGELTRARATKEDAEPTLDQLRQDLLCDYLLQRVAYGSNLPEAKATVLSYIDGLSPAEVQTHLDKIQAAKEKARQEFVDDGTYTVQDRIYSEIAAYIKTLPIRQQAENAATKIQTEATLPPETGGATINPDDFDLRTNFAAYPRTLDDALNRLQLTPEDRTEIQDLTECRVSGSSEIASILHSLSDPAAEIHYKDRTPEESVRLILTDIVSFYNKGEQPLPETAIGEIYASLTEGLRGNGLLQDKEILTSRLVEVRELLLVSLRYAQTDPEKRLRQAEALLRYKISKARQNDMLDVEW